jgi:hypothetical protein
MPGRRLRHTAGLDPGPGNLFGVISLFDGVKETKR